MQPEPRGHAGGMGELKAGLARRGDTLGQPAQEGLGALFHPERPLAQLAAELVGGLAEGDVSPAAQRDRCGQPGDPAADDQDSPSHAFSGVESSSWTSSVTRVSTSGSVSGRTPWPRLKM